MTDWADPSHPEPHMFWRVNVGRSQDNFQIMGFRDRYCSSFGGIMKKTASAYLARAAGATFVFLSVSVVSVASPLRTLPNLRDVVVSEQTFVRTDISYAPNAPELLVRLPDPLSDANSDFTFFPDENYDVFYSDSDGTQNVDGRFLTIEGRWTGTFAGGMNINAVQLVFGDGTTVFGDFVSSFVLGSVCNIGPSLCDPGSEAFAVDQNLGTFPRFGSTDPNAPNDRFRLTIGFNNLPVELLNIDIKPGSDPNCFNVNGNGVIPVAILGNEQLDVSFVDQTSLSFAGLEVRVRGNKNPSCGVEDVNGDGIVDLVCQFQDDVANWSPGSSDNATLVGSLLDGTSIEGSDSICVVP